MSYYFISRTNRGFPFVHFKITFGNYSTLSRSFISHLLFHKLILDSYCVLTAIRMREIGNGFAEFTHTYSKFIADFTHSTIT